MIIFHEGLPRSGKSYEAIVKQVLKYLKEGRQCFCFVDGLNFQKFSDILDLPIAELTGKVKKTPISIHEQSDHKYTFQDGNQLFSIEYHGLLFQIEEDQVTKIYDHVADDSFVVMDELQDYFPVSTKPLEMGIRQFVTKHGHRGIDILVMGQAHEDCHNLWKRRIDQLITFEKRDAVGLPNNYTWRSHKQQKKGGRSIFIPLRSGKGTYDKKYFGLYKSHTDGVENTDNHTDDRLNVLKSKLFTLYLPIFLFILGYAIYYLTTFFSSDSQIVDTVSINNQVEKYVPKQVPLKTFTNSSIKPTDIQTTQKEAEIKRLLAEKEKLEAYIEEQKKREYSHENYIQTIVKKYKPRLSGLIESDTKLVAYIQFLDESYHVHEELNLIQLASLGWSYERTPYGIKLIHTDVTLVVTSWPIDSTGRASNATISEL